MNIFLRRGSLLVTSLILQFSPTSGQEGLHQLLAEPVFHTEQFISKMDRVLVWKNEKSDAIITQLNDAIGQTVWRKDTMRTAWTIYYLGQVLNQRRDLGAAEGQFNVASGLFKLLRNVHGQERCQHGSGLVALSSGRLTLAASSMQRSLRFGEMIGDTTLMISSLGSLGYIAGLQNDLPMARGYYSRGAMLAEAAGWCRQHVNLLRGLGNTWKEEGGMDMALYSLELAQRILKNCGPHDRGMHAKLAVELGLVESEMGQLGQAMERLVEAQGTFDSLADNAWSSFVYSIRAGVMRKQGAEKEARALARKGLDLAQEHGLVKESHDNLLELHQLSASAGDFKGAYQYHLLLHRMHDSLVDREGIDAMVRLEMQLKQEKQLLADSLQHAGVRFTLELARERAERTRNIYLFGALGILMVAGGLLHRLRFIRRSRADFRREKELSDELLHNILPESVAAELKRNGRTEARHFEQATILFTDFKGFTSVSERLTASQLVSEVHECFKAFDSIIEGYGIEKIKTIGDAYMAAGGLPDPAKGSPLEVVHAALDLQVFMAKHKAQRDGQGRVGFEMRVGVHTGPVVAGVVGEKKFQYDIWGDTVNTASRLETSGEVGMVNISEATYARIKDTPGLIFDPRGKVQAKGKGELNMYFVSRIGDVSTDVRN